jgi:hypothetical protein
MKTTLITIAATLLMSCASNPTSHLTSYPTDVSENYRPVVGSAGDSHKVEPQYVHAGSTDEARTFYNQYIASGYHLIGYSTFTSVGGGTSTENIVAHAKKIHADVAIYSTQADGYADVNMPVAEEIAPGTTSETIINSEDEFGMSHEIGTATTTTPPQLRWHYEHQTWPRWINHIDFLAR